MSCEDGLAAFLLHGPAAACVKGPARESNSMCATFLRTCRTMFVAFSIKLECKWPRPVEP